MELTPRQLMRAIRAAALVAAVVVAIGLTGPFRYRDLHMPFPDKVFHALIFYVLAVLMQGALPRSRGLDLALALVGIGAASEVAQGLVGRDMELGDMVADTLGVAAAFLPALVGRFRALARLYPDVPFAELRQLDRRSPGRRSPVQQNPSSRPPGPGGPGPGQAPRSGEPGPRRILPARPSRS